MLQLSRLLSRSVFIMALVVLMAAPLSMARAEESKALPNSVENLSEKAKALAADVQQEVDQAAETASDKAEEYSDSASDAADNATGSTSSLTDDMKQARDIIMKNAGDNSFARGLIIALLQPIFLASMFSLGLLAGQMSERLKHIWVLPVIMYVATVIGAFITTYHAEWKPQFDSEHLKYFGALQSTDMVAVVIGVIVGVTVGFSLAIPAIFAILGAVSIGLILGFSQTADIGDHHDSLLPFWSGFGLTGLLINIFGIGFETFFQSINLKMVTRLIGIATAALSLFLGAKLL